MVDGRYIIDATMGMSGGLFCFCPIEGDFNILTGLNILSDVPPHGGGVVAIVHEDGDEAVEHFCDEYADELDTLRSRIGA